MGAGTPGACVGKYQDYYLQVVKVILTDIVSFIQIYKTECERCFQFGWNSSGLSCLKRAELTLCQ